MEASPPARIVVNLRGGEDGYFVLVFVFFAESTASKHAKTCILPPGALPAQAPVPRPVLPEACRAGESRTAEAAGGGKRRLIFSYTSPWFSTPAVPHNHPHQGS
jgi:hypothetical protein